MSKTNEMVYNKAEEEEEEEEEEEIEEFFLSLIEELSCINGNVCSITTEVSFVPLSVCFPFQTSPGIYHFISPLQRLSNSSPLQVVRSTYEKDSKLGFTVLARILKSGQG